jgi:iron complex transport system substrate-binding protein
MRQFPPRRIVCLTEETVETLYLLGEQDRIVGVSGYAVRPPQVRREKPRVSAFISADIPKILTLEPDLVLAFSDLQAAIVADLVRAGVAVHVFNQRDIAGILAMIRTLGALVGAGQRAARLATQYEQRLAQISGMVRPSPKPKVYFEEWDDPLISGIGWVSELIEIAGGEDILPALRSRARRDPRLMVRQEGGAGSNPAAPGLERYSGGAQQSHRRDQVSADPAARPRRADRRAGCNRQGAVARSVGWAKARLRRAHRQRMTQWWARFALPTLRLCFLHPAPFGDE